MKDKENYKIHSEVPRRSLLKSMFGAAVANACSNSLPAIGASLESWNSINPRWYGFNLLEYFSTDPDWMKYFPYKDGGKFKEDDFRWMRDWGFNYARLPMDYRFWTDPNDPMKIEDKKIEPIDRAIRLGEKYGIHINICLVRAPGYCILDFLDEKFTQIHVAREKTSLYTDQATLDAFAYQWAYFAKRYKGISNNRLSFNLVNEPIVMDKSYKPIPDSEKEYVRVALAAIAGIRANDPKRLIVTDGYQVGRSPIPELFDTGILQSAHDYFPDQLSSYRTEWLRPVSDNWPLPTWPLQDAKGKIIADKQAILEQFRPWGELAQHGIPIYFGEIGCYKYTPPEVVYSWFNDTLDVISSLHSGWALWNFRGPYGILDTERAGTRYKGWHGHQLDFTLLNLLQSKMKV